MSAAAEPASLPGSPTYRRLAMFTGMLAAFTMVLTGTIVNVAVPDVMGAFGVGQDRAQFLSTAFIATMTASQLLNAWFIAVFGRRLAFTVVLVVFVAGGLLCASSPTLDFIIVGRVMQGFASGIVQPLVLTTVLGLFPSDRRGTATGIYIAGLALALGFGPVVGGITIDALSWRWIFLVPLPFVGVSLLLGAFFVPEDAGGRTPQSFDWTGYLLLCTALFCLMSAIASGQREGWGSDRILAYWTIGTLAAAAFVHSQLSERARLLEFALFRNPRFAAAVLLTFIFGVGNFCITYAIPVFGQLVLGLTPTAAGMLLLPAGLVAVALTLLVGRLTDHFSPMVLILAGLGMFAVGTVLLSRGDVNTPFLSVALFTVVCRVGTAFVGPSVTAIGIQALSPEQLNQGSGTINFFRQMGGAFGINALVVLLERRADLHAQALAATQSADNGATRELLSGATDLLARSGLPEALREQVALDYLGQITDAQAVTLAWRDGFLAVAAIFVVAVVPTWVLGRARRRQGSRAVA